MGKICLFILHLFQTMFRSVKFLPFLLIAIVIALHFITKYKFIDINKQLKDNKLKLKNVIVHLDLKGSPPKISYLMTLLPQLKSLGVTGLLMEYEDMFPYQGQLANLSATNHYEMKELVEFLTTAKNFDFDIIPLMQTFGHMEYALKLQEFQHLREIPLYPDSVCPSQVGSIELIKNMFEQIIKFHEKIVTLKYFHIGANEVYHINKCEQCLKRHQTQMDIYTNHVKTVLGIIKTASPNTTVLIWDDMFRNIPIDKWKHITFENNNLEPVYWEYKPAFKICHSSMMEYHRKFKNIWIASAFKGADGRTATFPDLRSRFRNHFSWLKTIVDYKFGGESDVDDFRGIILTGWSRYSHMDPPCELLPVSIPSLYLNLLLIKKFHNLEPKTEDYVDADDLFNKYLKENFTENLHCSDNINTQYFNATNCNFSENILFNTLKHYNAIITYITNEISIVESELSILQFYSKTNNFNIRRLQENIKWCNQSMTKLKYIKQKLPHYLLYYYDSSFVDEYVNYKLFRPMNIINKLFNTFQNMYKVQSWTRRSYS